MKRLKSKLLAMKGDTTTYKEMYEGEMTVVDPEIITQDGLLEWQDYDPKYYYCLDHGKDICFEITRTHKLALDRPTVTVSIPCENLGVDSYSTAAADFCLREIKPYIDELNEALYNRSRPENESGKYYLGSPGGEVIERNSAYFKMCMQKGYKYGTGSEVFLLTDGAEYPSIMCLCIKLQVQLPKRNMRKTIRMLCRDLPYAVERFIASIDYEKYNASLDLAKRQAAIRKWLKNSEYCAFIANGSILPRIGGTDMPMRDAVPFRSTPDDEIEVCGVRGMGIRKGVTVITGGGYSGKTTLLDAISAGIYDHVHGDGREFCITDESAVTVSAEDGRSVKRVNISPFIRWLPGGDTSDFSTEHASGSTSQAANIMEAVDGGSHLLLIDEDRSATNFMIRDRMMKELIVKEPITPFTDRVKELYSACQVSTILVIGGSGEYLSVADRIYMMEDYLISDVTERAKAICEPQAITAEPPQSANWAQERELTSKLFSSYPCDSGSERLLVSDMGFIFIGDERIDVRGLYNITSQNQLNALGFMLRYLEVTNADSIVDIKGKVDELYMKIKAEGMDFLYSDFFTDCGRFLELPRKQELFALICRMRKTNYTKSVM